MIRIFIIVWAAMLAACMTNTAPGRHNAKLPNIPVEKKDCETPLGPLADGDKAEGFLNEYEPVGKSCQLGVLVCHDGEWTGEYVHKKCIPGGRAP